MKYWHRISLKPEGRHTVELRHFLNMPEVYYVCRCILSYYSTFSSLGLALYDIDQIVGPFECRFGRFFQTCKGFVKRLIPFYFLQFRHVYTMGGIFIRNAESFLKDNDLGMCR